MIDDQTKPHSDHSCPFKAWIVSIYPHYGSKFHHSVKFVYFVPQKQMRNVPKFPSIKAKIRLFDSTKRKNAVFAYSDSKSYHYLVQELKPKIKNGYEKIRKNINHERADKSW